MMTGQRRSYRILQDINEFTLKWVGGHCRVLNIDMRFKTERIILYSLENTIRRLLQ